MLSFRVHRSSFLLHRLSSCRAMRDDDDGEQRGDGCREQAVLTEGVQDEGLHVEQPEARGEHERDEDGEQLPGACRTESRERGKAEGGEIGRAAAGGGGAPRAPAPAAGGGGGERAKKRAGARRGGSG